MLWDRVTPKPVNQTSLIADVTALTVLIRFCCAINVFIFNFDWTRPLRKVPVVFSEHEQKAYVSLCDHLSSVCDRLYGADGLTVVRSLGLRPKDRPCVVCSNPTAR